VSPSVQPCSYHVLAAASGAPFSGGWGHVAPGHVDLWAGWGGAACRVGGGQLCSLKRTHRGLSGRPCRRP
jgi:hypothetical protein